MSDSRAKLKKRDKVKLLRSYGKKFKEGAPARPRGRPAKNKKIWFLAPGLSQATVCKKARSGTPPESEGGRPQCNSDNEKSNSDDSHPNH